MKCDPDRCSPRGFSLIELLVVISIVSVMVAMLLPSLSAARDTARGSRCASNLRQSYLGFNQYMTNNKNFWILSGYNHNVIWSRIVMRELGLRYVGEQGMNIGPFAWNGNVASDQGYGAPLYVYGLTARNRGNAIMKCPTENFRNAWGGDNATSYRFNSGYTYGYGLGVSDDYTTHTNPTYRAVWGRIKDQQLPKAAETFVIADGVNADGSYEYDITNLNTIAKLSTYHNGGANALFADGHASPVNPLFVTASGSNGIFDRRRN